MAPEGKEWFVFVSIHDNQLRIVQRTLVSFICVNVRNLRL